MMPPRMPPKMIAGMPSGIRAWRKATHSSRAVGLGSAAMPMRPAVRQM